MQKKIDELEKLVYEVCKKLTTLERENRSLTGKLKTINAKLAELSKSEHELAKLINWKKKTFEKLTRLKSKIEVLIGERKKLK